MIIELMNGKKIDIAEYSMKRLYHFIPSINVTHETSPIDGGVGSVFLDSRFSNRTITVRFLYESYDIDDYYLLRDEINALFTRKEPFYIIFKAESYKRYKVRLNGDFLVTPNQFMEQFEVEFICEELFGESIGTTKTHKDWDLDRWGWNGSIDWDTPLRYAFTTNNFVVKNLGNVNVDPRYSYLQIEFEGVFPAGMTVTNLTTGDVYSYNRPLTTNDIVVLDRVETFVNNEAAFSNTNKKLLTLAPGDNNFLITGGTVESVIFDFKFLFL